MKKYAAGKHDATRFWAVSPVRYNNAYITLIESMTDADAKFNRVVDIKPVVLDFQAPDDYFLYGVENYNFAKTASFLDAHNESVKVTLADSLRYSLPESATAAAERYFAANRARLVGAVQSKDRGTIQTLQQWLEAVPNNVAESEVVRKGHHTLAECFYALSEMKIVKQGAWSLETDQSFRAKLGALVEKREAAKFGDLLETAEGKKLLRVGGVDLSTVCGAI
jgi:hypothetical protein